LTNQSSLLTRTAHTSTVLTTFNFWLAETDACLLRTMLTGCKACAVSRPLKVQGAGPHTNRHELNLGDPCRHKSLGTRDVNFGHEDRHFCACLPSHTFSLMKLCDRKGNLLTTKPECFQAKTEHASVGQRPDCTHCAQVPESKGARRQTYVAMHIRRTTRIDASCSEKKWSSQTFHWHIWLAETCKQEVSRHARANADAEADICSK